MLKSGIMLLGMTENWMSLCLAQTPQPIPPPSAQPAAGSLTGIVKGAVVDQSTPIRPNPEA
jgi:hypothetical protein